MGDKRPARQPVCRETLRCLSCFPSFIFLWMLVLLCETSELHCLRVWWGVEGMWVLLRWVLLFGWWSLWPGLSVSVSLLATNPVPTDCLCWLQAESTSCPPQWAIPRLDTWGSGSPDCDWKPVTCFFASLPFYPPPPSPVPPLCWLKCELWAYKEGHVPSFWNCLLPSIPCRRGVVGHLFALSLNDHCFSVRLSGVFLGCF